MSDLLSPSSGQRRKLLVNLGSGVKSTTWLHEVVSEAPAGPVVAPDMLYGFGPALAEGRLAMAHRCGFTPTLLLQKLQEAPFAEIVLRRRVHQELFAVACKRASAGDAER